MDPFNCCHPSVWFMLYFCLLISNTFIYRSVSQRIFTPFSHSLEPPSPRLPRHHSSSTLQVYTTSAELLYCPHYLSITPSSSPLINLVTQLKLDRAINHKEIYTLLGVINNAVNRKEPAIYITKRRKKKYSTYHTLPRYNHCTNIHTRTHTNEHIHIRTCTFTQTTTVTHSCSRSYATQTDVHEAYT